MGKSKKQLHEKEPFLPEYCKQKGDFPDQKFSAYITIEDGFAVVQYFYADGRGAMAHYHCRYRNKKRFGKGLLGRIKGGASLGTSGGAE